MHAHHNVTTSLPSTWSAWEFPVPELLRDSLMRATDGCGDAFVVGGAVRDHFLGKASKDIDFCVTGVSYADVEQHLSSIPQARVDLVGKSFGIIKVSIPHQGERKTYDVAIPRADKNRQEVLVDPTIPIEEDLRRRDFTINAMAVSLRHGNIIGPSGSHAVDERRDIDQRIIRAVGDPSQRFDEDPLRILRGLQFAARMDGTIDPATWDAMHQCSDRLKVVSHERFYDEFMKGYQSQSPHVMHRLVKDLGIDHWLAGQAPLTPMDIHDRSDGEMGRKETVLSWFLDGGDPQLIVQLHQDLSLIRSARHVVDAALRGDWKSVSPLIRSRHDTVAILLRVLRSTRHPHRQQVESLFSRPLTHKVGKGASLPWETSRTAGEVLQAYKEAASYAPLSQLAHSDIQKILLADIDTERHAATPVIDIFKAWDYWVTSHDRERHLGDTMGLSGSDKNREVG